MEFKCSFLIGIGLLLTLNAVFCQELKLSDIVMRTTGGKDSEILAYKVNDESPFTGTVVDKSGSPTTRFTYKNGKLNGPQVTFNNGVKVEESVFNGNGKNGPFFQYFDDGSVEVKGQFKNDYEAGVWTAVYRNGKTKYSGTYVDGEREGQWRHFDESGLLNRIDFYSKGIFIKTVAYQDGKEQGNAVSVSELSVRMVDGHSRYYRKNSDSPFSGLAFEVIDDSLGNGLRKEFQVQDSKPIGRWTLYYNNHTPKATGFYEDGLMHGKYFEYFENGKIKIAGEYWRGLKNGSWTFYTESGYYYLIGTMLKDTKHSVWRYFNSQGDLIREERYVLGDLQE